MLYVFSVAWLALAPTAGTGPAPAPAPPGGNTTVIPFRTTAQPRVDPVFGDASALRGAVDRFFTLEGEMERVRDEFSTAVHETLAALAGSGVASGAKAATPPKSCPVATAAPYSRALAAGTRYLALGQDLQARYRDIRRADDLGDAAALTPDYRTKIKKARELHQHLLDDYREMRVAFYDQLGAEMRYASCKMGPTKPTPTPTDGEAPTPPNPSDANAWTLDDSAVPDEPRVAAPPPKTTEKRPPSGADPTAPAAGTMAAPAIWIDVDNTLCPQPTRVSVDGQPLGEVGARKKTSVRTHAGPREICALPASDSRTCGDPGTVRKAYLHEGWSLTVHCQ
jgi:hypothetical protein